MLSPRVAVASGGVLFALLAVIWFLAARGDQPQFRRASLLFVTGTVLYAVALTASAFLPAGVRVLAWGLTGALYIAGFTTGYAMTTSALAAAFSISDALLERFGLLIIIVLGETVTGVVGGLARTTADALTLAVALAAAVTGFGVWRTYFDFVGHRPPRPERLPTAVWVLAHLPLTAAVATIGAAMVSFTGHAHASRTATATAWALCAGTAAVLLATAVLTTTAQAWREQPGCTGRCPAPASPPPSCASAWARSDRLRP